MADFSIFDERDYESILKKYGLGNIYYEDLHPYVHKLVDEDDENAEISYLDFFLGEYTEYKEKEEAPIEERLYEEEMEFRKSLESQFFPGNY